MPTLAEKLRRTVYKGRAIAGSLGFRPHTVAVVYEWADDATGQGEAGSEETPLTEASNQPPKVVWTADDDQSTDAPPGCILVGPITPMPGVRELLTRKLEAGESRYLMVRGPRCPDGQKFQITNVEDKPLRLMIRAQDFAAAYTGYG